MTNHTFSALSPAKVNLFLHVTGRRADGYHLLESIFCPIDLNDEISIHLSPAPDGRLSITRSGDLCHIPHAKDLTVRAVQSFCEYLDQTDWHFDLHVKKTIPEQAGLGGGSSNAATVLKLLQEHIGTDKTEMALPSMAARLGADVPFFLQHSCAFVSGIGEQIKPISVPPGYLVLLKPEQSCPTGQIFAAKQLTRDTSPVKIPVFDSSAASEGKVWWHWLNSNTTNSLQRVVESEYPNWLACFEQFEAVAKAAGTLLTRMTGSGSVMFAVFDKQSRALACSEQLATLGFSAIVAKLNCGM